MINCGKALLFGIVMGIATTISIKLAYEYGRYSAIHEVYKRGWTVVTNDDDDDE